MFRGTVSIADEYLARDLRRLRRCRPSSQATRQRALLWHRVPAGAPGSLRFQDRPGEYPTPLGPRSPALHGFTGDRNRCQPKRLSGRRSRRRVGCAFNLRIDERREGGDGAPQPREPPGGVVRSGKIRKGPFLILPIRHMPPAGRVVLRGKTRNVVESLSSRRQPSLRKAARDAIVKESLSSLFVLPRAAAARVATAGRPPVAPAGSATGRAPAGRPIRGSPAPERRG